MPIWRSVGITDNKYRVGVTDLGELKAHARQSGAWTVTPDSIDPVVSLDEAAVTGPGIALDAGQVVPGVTLMVDSTGSPAAMDVEVQVSVDGTTWFNTGAAITISGTSALASAHGRYYRANLIVLTGGTSPTVTAVLATSF